MTPDPSKAALVARADQLEGGLSPLSQHPLVSVIIPSRNHAEYLPETLDSVLTQDYDPLEVIVVDGASTDGTLEVLQTYEKDSRLRWISEPDNGPTEADNKGFQMARGELIGIMPVTDAYLPGAVRELVQEFTLEPALAWVGGWHRQVDLQGIPTGVVTMLKPERFDYSVDDVVQLLAFPRLQATLYRRDLVMAIGGFDESMGTSFGPFALHYMLEVLRRGAKVRAIPKVLANYRLHPNQMHTNTDFANLSFFLHRRAAYEQLAKKYRDFLTPMQVKTLRRTGYYSELRYRTQVRKQTLSAIPAAFGYARFGGAAHLAKKLGHYLARPIGLLGRHRRR